MSRLRETKKRIVDAVASERWIEELQAAMEDYAPGQLVGPLFSLLLHGGETKWRAVAGLGMVVPRWAEQDLNDGRKILRRIMWNLNEESASVPWGQPETMGEILAHQPTLAKEFHKILISYAWETGRNDNYLDHDPLRRGAFWGVGRLCEARPELMALTAIPALLDGLRDPDAPCRGLAAWCFCLLGGHLSAEHKPKAIAGLRELTGEDAPVELFRDNRLIEVGVGELAREALESLGASNA